jgi:hypothetical protein
MATSGTLNVVCHGSIVFVVGNDGAIELLLPKIDPKWDHRYEAGSWTGDRLMSLQIGEEYQLAGVEAGDGKQRFDPKVNIIIEGPLRPMDVKELRRFRLPPPRRIYSANLIPMSTADTFENAADPHVAGMQQLATLSVLSYDCEDLSAARLLTDGGHDFKWLPEIVMDGVSDAVNLHIFAEPWTFRPLEIGSAYPDAPLPFNVLLDCVGGDPGLTMLPPGNDGWALFADINPGAPIAGLPEPEKLALSEHSQIVRYGLSYNKVHPYDCGQVVVQKSGAVVQPEHPKANGFAPLQNRKPKVLAHPRVAVIYWGTPDIDTQVDATVRQLLGLDFIQSALAEYGVDQPQYVDSAANPQGSKTEMEDSERVLTTPERSPIAGGLNDLILAGKVPDPRQDPNLLYLVVAAPGANSKIPGISGGHNYFYLEIPGGDQGCERVPVRYAWALRNPVYGSTLTSLDNLTWTLSHELLEACTDPEPPNGYVFEGAEICDIAAGLHGTVDGIEVTGYFSYKDGVYKTPGAKPRLEPLADSALA